MATLIKNNNNNDDDDDDDDDATAVVCTISRYDSSGGMH
jgi:hypothetical protein